MGSLYQTGQGVRQDDAQAAYWFRKAAEQGDSDAQFKLGLMYGAGKGVRQDVSTAKEWFGKACLKGHRDSCEIYLKLNGPGGR